MGELFPFAIPIMGMGIAYFAIWTKHQRRLAEMRLMTAARDPGADAAANQRIAALEDRVRVLERIATDRKLTLADEIEALRDLPAPAVASVALHIAS